MGTKYDDKFLPAEKAALSRRSERNNEITVNRAGYAQSLAAFDRAMMAGDEDAAQRAREACEKADADVQWLHRALEATKDGGRYDPVVIEAGEEVLVENRAIMAGHNDRWDHIAKNMEEHKTAIMELTAELGKIQMAGKRLRAQAEHVFTVTGSSSPWLAAPGDKAVNLDKQKGLIYVDPKLMTTIYRKGKI
jgi:hypothetical protein